jgi:hypothetical protein
MYLQTMLVGAGMANTTTLSTDGRQADERTGPRTAVPGVCGKLRSGRGGRRRKRGARWKSRAKDLIVLDFFTVPTGLLDVRAGDEAQHETDAGAQLEGRGARGAWGSGVSPGIPSIAPHAERRRPTARRPSRS